MVSQYLNAAKHRGDKIYTSKYVILAVQRFFPQVGVLKRAWRCLTSWQDKIPRRNRVPLPENVMQRMFVEAINLGCLGGDDAHLWFPFAVILRVMYYAILRPVEAISLTVCDVLFACSQHFGDLFGDVCVLSIKSPKNRNFMGQNQFSLLFDDATLLWLRWTLVGLGGHVKIFPSSLSVFRRLFNYLLQILCLSHLGLSPASARAGGTTFHYMRQMSIGRLKFLGRWSYDKSLSCYVQEAVAFLVTSQISDEDKQAIEAVLFCASEVLARPPSAGWRKFFNRRLQQNMRRLRLLKQLKVLGQNGCPVRRL